MAEIQQFWNAIAEAIQEKFGNGHPETWNKYKITIFLTDFSTKLGQLCSQDERKAILCGAKKNRAGELTPPTITYHSFRRIFITKESSGNRSTREMFAIYLGYDSAHDFMVQKGIWTALEPDDIATPWARKRARLWLAIATLLALIGFSVYWSRPTETRYAFVRNELGIVLVNLSKERRVKLTPYTEDIAGLEFDPQTRTLFWACPNIDYQSIGCVKLKPNFSGVEIESLNRNLTPKMEGPVGIALDTRQQFIYCSDYKDSLILKFDYHGKLVDTVLTEKLPGAPSSIVLDAKNQILYWTDIDNNRIGRLFLLEKRAEPYFITNAGEFPDGLSIDTLNRRLYWASHKSSQIGWVQLPNSVPHLVSVSDQPAAVEVDAKQGVLYYAIWKSPFVGKILLSKLHSAKKISKVDSFFVEAAHPGVIKVLNIKN
ncbi:hypothetical protein [Haliscomenobacter sp.]|uniref:hypothetical protein n=1 Tax=Haliscomenobacter sp. TaxID=2717303 RepID=UPI003BAD660A